jgi:hypothetical protein
LTTYRDLPLGAPTDEYLDAIRDGLAVLSGEVG